MPKKCSFNLILHAYTGREPNIAEEIKGDVLMLKESLHKTQINSSIFITLCLFENKYRMRFLLL